jgi:hypothetical protein
VDTSLCEEWRWLVKGARSVRTRCVRDGDAACGVIVHEGRIRGRDQHDLYEERTRAREVSSWCGERKGVCGVETTYEE